MEILMARLTRYSWYVPKTAAESIDLESAYMEGLVVRRLRPGQAPSYEYRLPDFSD